MRYVLFLIALLVPRVAGAQQLDVRVDARQAEAVLELVARGDSATNDDWRKLFTTEGFRRLIHRDSTFGRYVTDSAFAEFVKNRALAVRAPALRATLNNWKRVDPSEAGRMAFKYLPAGARIRATIYPVIKPRDNTFVWEARTNPAIFFYLDPKLNAEQFRSTLAHELHHLGVASVCPDTESTTDRDYALDWMSGFAEGRAVLAAAGGTRVHPHATSPQAERFVWDRHYVRASFDVARLDTFFLDILRGRTTPEERQTRGFAFITTDDMPQGAFYTVGYLMAKTVEEELGRERLVASLCDPVMFLTDYDRAAQRRNLPRFSAELLNELVTGQR